MSSPPEKIELFEDTNNYNLAFRCLRGSVIGIEGLIGAGKTTAITAIYNLLKECKLKVKLFKEYINPDLLGQYIKNMKDYSYSFQVIMGMKRGNAYKDACEYAKSGGIALLDRTLVGDYAFAIMQKNNGNITESEWKVYKSIIKTEKGPQPSLIVNFDVDPEIAFARMRKRGRKDEVGGYTLQYFQNLKDNYKTVFDGIEKTTPLLNIDWNASQKLNGGCLTEKTTADLLYKFREKMMSY